MGINFKSLPDLSALFGKNKVSPETNKPLPPTPPPSAGTPQGLSTRTTTSSSHAPRTALPPSLPEMKPLPALPDFGNFQAADSAKPTLKRQKAVLTRRASDSDVKRPGDAPPRPQLNRRHSAPELSGSATQSRIFTGKAQIADVLSSKSPMDAAITKQIFGEKFQSKEGWQTQFNGQLHGSVSDTLKNTTDWNTQTFQALFMAAWATHPTEKGAYMIDLSSLDGQQLESLKQAHQEHCTGRPSSHFSGQGRSASKGYEFLNGYQELLVQTENIGGKPYLFMKTEGHTTGIAGAIPHTLSLFKKMQTGEGMMASPVLHDVAKTSDLVEGRAAENFAKNYGKLLKGLGLNSKDKFVPAQAMAEKLFAATNFKPGDQPTAKAFVAQANNEQLGQALMAYCDQASMHAAGSKLRRMGDQPITGGMLSELRDVARSLIADGASDYVRVHREVLLTPQQMDATLKKFE